MLFKIFCVFSLSYGQTIRATKPLTRSSSSSMRRCFASFALSNDPDEDMCFDGTWALNARTLSKWFPMLTIVYQPFPFVIVPSEAGEIDGSTINLLRPWGLRLRFRHPRLRSLQNGISERKTWKNMTILPESDESSKVALFARLPKVAPGEIIFFVGW